MIYPASDPKKFSIKHGVPIISETCRGCNAEVEVNIPVISNDFVGFESLEHQPCGREFVISYLKPLKKWE
jgi:hypothetical protein